MDTIALWEEEIAESNRSHFFENTARAIDYLMESIELDYKLIEAGIITEAGEEDTSSNDNDIPVDLKIGEKIKLFLKRLAAGLVAIIDKIRSYIKNKVKDFQQKRIVDKFMNSKIDEEKMIAKLNKTKLFDPEMTYQAYGQNGVFGEEVGKVFNEPIYGGPNVSYSIDVNKYNAKVHELEALSRPEDFRYTHDKNTKEPLIIKINPNNAKAQIKDLYDNTVKVMETIDTRVKDFADIIKKKETEIGNIKNKDQLKFAKSVLQLYKVTYKGCTRISTMYLKQSVFLANIMLGYIHNGNAEEDNTEENTEKEEA